LAREQTSASRAPQASPGDLRLLSDEALFEGIRNGSEPHFNTLYDRYFRRVYGFVHARVRDHADAEELAQESFIAVFRGIAGYSGRSTPLAWIYGIAKNTVNNHRRRLRAQTERVDAAGPEALHSTSAQWRSTPLDDFELRQSLRRVDQRLHAVTGWQLEVFWLRHVDDLSIDEIAQRLDRSNDAIRSSLYRVKRLISEGLVGDAADAAAVTA
jgi:RNA polymerase sigma-70 factor (ECF subfamily)